MAFGPIVMVKLDSKLPHCLNTFCCLRVLITWVFEFSKFNCTTIRCQRSAKHYFASYYSAIAFGAIVVVELDSRSPSGLKPFACLRFWRI